MQNVFANKQTMRQFPRGGVYPFKLRLQQLRVRSKPYEPTSWKHLACRRVGAIAPKALIRLLISVHKAALDEEFVLFPLHVSPEATLLGSHAELVDQFGLIKNISVNLPFGVRLYVKEHPAQSVGYGLDYGFCRRLTSLPNACYFKVPRRCQILSLILVVSAWQ